MTSDITAPNMDGLNRAGAQGDLAAAGGKQANLKLAQQFMALAQSDNAPNDVLVIESGHITVSAPTVSAPQDKPKTPTTTNEDKVTVFLPGNEEFITIGPGYHDITFPKQPTLITDCVYGEFAPREPGGDWTFDGSRQTDWTFDGSRQTAEEP